MNGKKINSTAADRIIAKVRAGASETATYATAALKSIFQSQAARRSRQSALNELIERLARQNPGISEKALLRALRREEGKGVIVEITSDDKIKFRTESGTIVGCQGSGLKDRLTKVKRKIRQAG